MFVCNKVMYFKVFTWKKTALYCILTWPCGYLANLPNTIRNYLLIILLAKLLCSCIFFSLKKNSCKWTTK